MGLLVSSRRAPYPWDMIVGSSNGVGGVGVMLKPDGDGLLVGKKAQPLEAQPITYEYGSQSPYLERTYPMVDLVLGMGQRVQESGAPRRYYYGLNIDASINGRLIKGPKFVSQTVDTAGTNAVRYMQRALYSSSEVVYVAAGARLYRRLSDGQLSDTGTASAGAAASLTDASKTWTADQWKDNYAVTILSGTGAGQSRVISTNTGTVLTISPNWSVNPDATSVYQITPFHLVSTLTGNINQMARFKFAGGVPRDSLFIATSSGKLYELDGSGTTTADITAAAATQVAAPQYVEVVGDELWVGGGNLIAKCEADPSVGANWDGAITIGNAARRITWLRQNHNELFIFKEDGVFTVSTAGLDQELFPGLRLSPSTSNGLNASTWLDALYAPFGDGFYRIEADGTLSPIGSEQLLDNGSEVRGRTVASAGHNTWFNYVVIYNDQNSNSYLLKLGSWMEENQDGRMRDVLKFRDVYHGALKKWAAKQAVMAQTMIMTNDNDRLYVGFATGTLDYCVLPKNGPNPANDTNCTFTLEDAELYWPQHHAGFQADIKEYRGFSVFGPKLDSDNYAEVYYQLDPTNAEAGIYEPLLIDNDTTVLDSGADGVTNGTNTFTAAGGSFATANIGHVISIGGKRRTVRTTPSATSATFGGATITSAVNQSWSLTEEQTAAYTLPSQRVDFDQDQRIYSKAIYVKIVLVNTSASETPVVAGAAIHEQVHPAFIVEYSFTIKAHNHLARRDGAVDRRRAETIRAALRDAINTPGAVEIMMPHEARERVAIIDYPQEMLLVDSKRYGIEWDIAVRGIQYPTLTQQTAAASGTNVPYANLVGFSYGTLEGYTYDELESLVL